MSKNKAKASNNNDFTEDLPPPPINKEQGGNRAAMQAAMYAEIDTLAEQEGRGGNARPQLAVMCVKWAKAGMADTGDAEPIYKHYIDKVDEVTAVFGGIRKKGTEEVGLKQNVSKIRQFLKLGAIERFNTVELIEEAQEVIKQERAKGTISTSPFDSLLNIAREQNKKDMPRLEREDMIRVNKPKDRPDVQEVDSLAQIIRRLEAHAAKYGDRDETTQALDLLEALTKSLGGTSADRRTEERVEKLIDKQEQKRTVKRK
jgi:hypothetical protein